MPTLPALPHCQVYNLAADQLEVNAARREHLANAHEILTAAGYTLVGLDNTEKTFGILAAFYTLPIDNHTSICYIDIDNTQPTNQNQEPDMTEAAVVIAIKTIKHDAFDVFAGGADFAGELYNAFVFGGQRETIYHATRVQLDAWVTGIREKYARPTMFGG